MKKIETGFDDLYILDPQIFGDQRGYFFESYNNSRFADLGLNYKFIQDNESHSKFGTLRGLHFQKNEFAQAKLVRVVFGRVLDVVVDLRKEKSTFGKYFSILLDADTKRLLMVPRGFAHGFVVLSEQATFQYKVDNVYNAGSEGGIIFDDATLSIDWMIPQKDLILSEKDRKLQSFLDWKKSS